MAKHPPYSVVLTYKEDLQQLIVYTVDPNDLAPLVAGRMGVVMADEHDFKLDDEFARQLGVGMLNTIALGQPSIKQYMSVTEEPIDRSSEEEFVGGSVKNRAERRLVIATVCSDGCGDDNNRV